MKLFVKNMTIKFAMSPNIIVAKSSIGRNRKRRKRRRKRRKEGKRRKGKKEKRRGCHLIPRVQTTKKTGVR